MPITIKREAEYTIHVKETQPFTKC